MSAAPVSVASLPFTFTGGASRPPRSGAQALPPPLGSLPSRVCVRPQGAHASPLVFQDPFALRSRQLPLPLHRDLGDHGGQRERDRRLGPDGSALRRGFRHGQKVRTALSPCPLGQGSGRGGGLMSFFLPQGCWDAASLTQTDGVRHASSPPTPTPPLPVLLSRCAMVFLSLHSHASVFRVECQGELSRPGFQSIQTLLSFVLPPAAVFIVTPSVLHLLGNLHVLMCVSPCENAPPCSSPGASEAGSRV